MEESVAWQTLTPEMRKWIVKIEDAQNLHSVIGTAQTLKIMSRMSMGAMLMTSNGQASV